MHFVGFIIGICHDARSSECQMILVYVQVCPVMKYLTVFNKQIFSSSCLTSKQEVEFNTSLKDRPCLKKLEITGGRI